MRDRNSPGELSLEGGRGDYEGNLMVGVGGAVPKPVCDDDWTLVNADVACKQLGFVGAVAMTRESRFGRVSSSFGMDGVRCTGNEERLKVVML